MLLPTAPKFQDLKLTCIKWIYSRFWDPGTDSINNYQVRFLVGQGNGKRFWFLILSSNTMLLPTAPKFQDLKSTCIKWIFPDHGTAFWWILEPIVLILPGQTLSGPGQRKEKTKRKEKERDTRMTKKKGKITKRECMNLFNSDGPSFSRKKDPPKSNHL